MNNCKTCIYRLFDPLWAEYRCRLSGAKVQNVDAVRCSKYKKGDPANYVEPKEPKPGPLSYKIITENGSYKASTDGIIGFSEVNVQVPVYELLDDYLDKVADRLDSVINGEGST